jgi:cytidyltransferase-like protein
LVKIKGKKLMSAHSHHQKVVAVSGGFDPIHIGHVRLFNEAKMLGEWLVVIINNDNWLIRKKGYVFMPEDERKEIVEAFKAVDQVVISSHQPNPQDMSVSKELRKIRPHIFANGGDRGPGSIPEDMVCDEIRCQMVFNVGTGAKIQSSSWLVEKFRSKS